MGRLFDSVAKGIFILKLGSWAIFALSLFSLRFIKSRFVKGRPTPQTPLAVKTFAETALTGKSPQADIDPYRPVNYDSADIPALRYL